MAETRKTTVKSYAEVRAPRKDQGANLRRYQRKRDFLAKIWYESDERKAGGRDFCEWMKQNEHLYDEKTAELPTKMRKKELAERKAKRAEEYREKCREKYARKKAEKAEIENLVSMFMEDDEEDDEEEEGKKLDD